MVERYVSDVGLVLSPGLQGDELASPRRRFAVFVIDAAFIWIPSMVVALLVAWTVIAVREPAALFTALSEFWRDPNRRLPHDRLSSTLVIRVGLPV